MSSDSEDSSDDEEEEEHSSTITTGRTDRNGHPYDKKKSDVEKIKSKNATKFNFDLKSTQKTMIERLREKERKEQKGFKKGGKIGVRFKEGKEKEKEKEKGVGEAHYFSKASALSTSTSTSTSTSISTSTSSEKIECDYNSFLFPKHYPTEREGSTDMTDNDYVGNTIVSSFKSKSKSKSVYLNYNPKPSSIPVFGFGSRSVHDPGVRSRPESGSGSRSGSVCAPGLKSAYNRSYESNRGDVEGKGEKNSSAVPNKGFLESLGEAILTLFTQKVSSSSSISSSFSP